MKIQKNKLIILSFLYASCLSGMHQEEIVFHVRCIAIKDANQLDYETIKEVEGKSARLGLDWHSDSNNKKYLKIIPLYKNGDGSTIDCSQAHPLELEQILKKPNRVFNYFIEDEQIGTKLSNAPFAEYIPYDVLSNNGQQAYDEDEIVTFSPFYEKRLRLRLTFEKELAPTKWHPGMQCIRPTEWIRSFICHPAGFISTLCFIGLIVVFLKKQK